MTAKHAVRKLCCVLGLISANTCQAQDVSDASHGTRYVEGFRLPLSEYLSHHAQAKMRAEIANGSAEAEMNNSAVLKELEQLRKGTDAWATESVAKLGARYPVEISRETWSGVPIVRVTPLNARNRQAKDRLLIELHGGGFVMGRADTMGLLDAIPVAALTGLTVVAVDYRKGPEHRYPAATEDVVSIYRVALEHFKPAHIGIFGCSSGGVLTSESLARFAKDRLPMPGAAGIFCAGGDARYGGDSRFVAAAVNDALRPGPNGELELVEDLYYGDVDFHDPMVSPVLSDSVLEKFPPTLFITATRAPDLSSAVHTHARLTALGRQTQLNVWDGLGHAFYFDAGLPESQQAFKVISRFFRARLGLDADG